MINVHGLRRNVKNVVRNYTDAQVKVREATSNDPWGPSSTLMSEIADLTYNVVAFSEIMQMVWKRLNDHGKNWRHVYKALVLLEYLIKTGSEKVAQQCKENIFAIQTLKDFQYIEDNKDQGMNVREKSKQLVSLLKDDERLRNERTRALKAKERFAQAAAHVGNDSYGKETSGHMELGNSDCAISPRELECARPQTAGEEELQLQLALAMSKEEAEMEDRMRRNDDLRLQMAITESQEDFKRTAQDDNDSPEPQSALDDLLAINLAHPGARSTVDPWGLPVAPEPNLNQTTDPWDASTMVKKPPSDPWGGNGINSPPAPKDPWAAPELDERKTDPWNSRHTPSSLDSLGAAAANGETDDFDILSKRSAHTSPVPGDLKMSPPDSRMSPNPFTMAGLSDTLNDNRLSGHSSPSRRTPETFLGANSNLVNLDSLVNAKNTAPAGATNPFAATAYNPFQAAKPPPPSINQLRAQNQFTFGTQPDTLQGNMNNTLPAPLIPTGGLSTGPVPAASNPFM